MPPVPGSIHRRPRSDSTAARLWTWARTRRAPWTCADALGAIGGSARRIRGIVAALHQAGILDQISASELTGPGGRAPAEWVLSDVGRALAAPPILITDAAAGTITGVRAAIDGIGTEQLREAISRSGLSGVAAATALGVRASTLRDLLRGRPPLAEDDPIIARARGLRGGSRVPR